MENIIEARNIIKKYKGFELNIPLFDVPKGFAVALIGENGAGKTTLLDILSGVNLDFKGEVTYYGEHKSADGKGVRDSIGYSASSNYFMAHWKTEQVKEVCSLLFDSFDGNKFDSICKKMSLTGGEAGSRTVSELSDGNKMKLMLASIFARNTRVLMMDEPASPLDPVMRDAFCDMIREYLDGSDGENSVIYSTHNISDMESVTDYAVIVANGRIAEQGFVEDLKEKYICVKGENSCAEKAKPYMYTYSKNSYGFEGIILSDNLNKLAGMDISTEAPTLHQISVAVMINQSKD